MDAGATSAAGTAATGTATATGGALYSVQAASAPAAPIRAGSENFIYSSSRLHKPDTAAPVPSGYLGLAMKEWKSLASNQRAA
jgi:hypothetical protein